MQYDQRCSVIHSIVELSFTRNNISAFPVLKFEPEFLSLNVGFYRHFLSYDKDYDGIHIDLNSR